MTQREFHIGVYKFVVAICAACTVACAHPSAAHQPLTANPWLEKEQEPAATTYSVVGKGIRCHGYAPPESTPNPVPAPLNFSIADINQKGVPILNPRQLSEIAAVAQQTHSVTLRFAFLPMLGMERKLPDGFIVFDASQGPCADFAPGYAVLNERARNWFYEPGENPYVIHAGAPY